MEFFTQSGLILANDYTRLVKGGRGDYIEFDDDQIVLENIHIPGDQKWRLTDKYKNTVFYDEWRSKCPSNVKLYFQRNFVGYADYNPGMW